jgi:group I intron endonuclease
VKKFFGRIYAITNIVNGKQYVGKNTTMLKQRWLGHLKDARNGDLRPLYRAIRKYGIAAFTIVQIDAADSKEELGAQETFHILRLKTLVPCGYNLKASDNREGMSDEAYHHICDARTDQSDTQRRKISETLKNKPRRLICRKRGHLFDEVNTYYSPGRRQCDTCRHLVSSWKLPKKLLPYLTKADQLEFGISDEDVAAINKDEDMCGRGHPFGKMTTYYRSNGSRQCWVCKCLVSGCKVPERLRPYVTAADQLEFGKRVTNGGIA